MAPEIIPVVIPQENVNDESVLLAAWRAGEREFVEQGRLLAEIETSKALLEILAPAAGHLRRAAAEGSSVPVGSILCYLTPGADDPLPQTTVDAAVLGETSVETARFSKKALDLMNEKGLKPASFAGKGLVREADVREVLGGQLHFKGLPVRRVELPARKLAEIRSLSAGQNDGLSSLVSVACPAAGLRRAVARRPELAATPLAWTVFEVGRLLRIHPLLNAYYDAGRLYLYDAVHVGFVVDAGKGLQVPVIHDVDRKELEDVARRMQDLLLAYEDDSMRAEDLTNGTFTISDLSAEGAVFIHPLINERQSAILGVAAARQPPGDPGETFDLILSFDHRVAEGRVAVQFLKDLRDRLNAA